VNFEDPQHLHKLRKIIKQISKYILLINKIIKYTNILVSYSQCGGKDVGA